MNNFLRRGGRLIFLFCFLIQDETVYGLVEASACRNEGVAIMFFNGVHTTPSSANRSIEVLRKIHGETSESGDRIRYEVLFNYSNGFEDFVETFDQRLREHEGLLEGRFELFLSIINGGAPWWESIVGVSRSAGEILGGLLIGMKPRWSEN